MSRRIARKNRITVVMEEKLKDDLERYAEENDRSMSDFIRLICKEWVEVMNARSLEEGGVVEVVEG